MNPNPPPPDPPPRRNTTFKGDVLRLVTGTGLAQIIGVLAAPILTRLYAPEAFGVAALFASLTGILSVLACMCYELSIVLPDNDREAANLLGVSLCFSVLIALLAVPIIGLGGAQVLRWVRMPELAPYLWLIPITVWISGIFTALNYWNIRTKHFTRLSIARVTIALTNTLGNLGAGFAGHATGGAMIAASAGGQVVATAVLGGQIWRNNGRFLVHSITWREIWAGLKRYRKFPMYSSWSVLLNVVSWQLPVVMLGAFFSPVVVGFYSLGFRILQMPMNLVGSAISQVFFQRTAEAKMNSTLGVLVEKSLKQLVRISIFPFLTFTIIGKDLFIVIFGSRWSEAGVYAQILSIWIIFWFTSSPLSTVVIVLQRQDIEFRLSFLSFVMRFSSIAIGGFLASTHLAICLFSLSGILVYGYLCLIVTTLVGIPWKHTISIYMFELLLFLPFGIGMITISIIFDNIWITFWFAGIVVAWHTVRTINFKNLVG